MIPRIQYSQDSQTRGKEGDEVAKCSLSCSVEGIGAAIESASYSFSASSATFFHCTGNLFQLETSLGYDDSLNLPQKGVEQKRHSYLNCFESTLFPYIRLNDREGRPGYLSGGVFASNSVLRTQYAFSANPSSEDGQHPLY
ncbi:hypothetical protein SLEP1_g59160 [Rubroshorea leprosula]|uniref:Ig-like domain-containing protein n=1 Tax=Rubroshorea leprosula TaxID=152421 RepID=A0AAV5MUC5_9ROSI|nr:hypothetical protein SLEP1_g59160 [Rubroshorea leprosula]